MAEIVIATRQAVSLNRFSAVLHKANCRKAVMIMGRYIPSKLRFEILERDKFTCGYCGAKAPDVSLQIDHIWPVCLGGDNRKSNLITSCVSCNNAKGTKIMRDFLSEEDQKDFAEKYREKVRQYGYETNYIKKVLRLNNLPSPSREIIKKFVERSFSEDDYEFSLFKKEFEQPKNVAHIIFYCNRNKISYKEYREHGEEDIKKKMEKDDLIFKKYIEKLNDV